MKNITADGSEPGNKGQQSAYVLTVGENPIGGLVVEQEEMIAAIRTSFDIERFIEFEQLEVNFEISFFGVSSLEILTRIYLETFYIIFISNPFDK